MDSFSSLFLHRSGSSLLISGSKVRVLDGPPILSGTPKMMGVPDLLSGANRGAASRQRTPPILARVAGRSMAVRPPSGESKTSRTVEWIRPQVREVIERLLVPGPPQQFRLTSTRRAGQRRSRLP